jgi:hypothetical protein
MGRYYANKVDRHRTRGPRPHRCRPNTDGSLPRPLTTRIPAAARAGVTTGVAERESVDGGSRRDPARRRRHSQVAVGSPLGLGVMFAGATFAAPLPIEEWNARAAGRSVRLPRRARGTNKHTVTRHPRRLTSALAAPLTLTAAAAA